MANCMNTICTNSETKRFFGKLVLNSLYLKPTDVYEVTDIISSLNLYKSSGLADIQLHQKQLSMFSALIFRNW